MELKVLQIIEVVTEHSLLCQYGLQYQLSIELGFNFKVIFIG